MSSAPPPADERLFPSSPLKFQPMSSSIVSAFWERFSERKLNLYRLSDQPVPIRGRYTPSPYRDDRIPGRLILDRTSFDDLESKEPESNGRVISSGELRNFNTIEAFKKADKNAILSNEGMRVWSDIHSGAAVTSPSLLSRFVILSFADLKKHVYIYWMGIPALVAPVPISSLGSPAFVKDVFSERVLEDIYSSLLVLRRREMKAGHNHFPGYFVCKTSGSFAFSLNEFESGLGGAERVLNYSQQEDLLFGFVDPCPLTEHPGWPLRNFLIFLRSRWGLERVNVLCFRDQIPHSVNDEGRSCEEKDTVTASIQEGYTSTLHQSMVIMNINLMDAAPVMDLNEPIPPTLDCSGWESNTKGKLGPRCVNLSSALDPERLAEQIMQLNLSLMRWRQIPKLELGVLANTRCLLLGAGTLGCGVARNLLSWGITKVTFVDSGRVSYSNPIRQNLFIFNDCLNGGRYKAEAAAEALSRIFPGVEANAEVFTIPMPGHPSISPEEQTATKRHAQRLHELISSHDAVFMLMDSRESRWLPTVICSAMDKLVVNAALGLDSFLVVRHGGCKRTFNAEAEDVSSCDVLSSLPYTRRLGCYFCNDVVAPENSKKDRTLDQQCTVTRPGLSPLACSLAVELMVGLLHYPLKHHAPADAKGEFGILPHQIRGFLSSLSLMNGSAEAFEHCTACSDKIIQCWEDNALEFVVQACNDPSHLESVSGLDHFRAMDSEEVMDAMCDDEGWELE